MEKTWQAMLSDHRTDIKEEILLFQHMTLHIQVTKLLMEEICSQIKGKPQQTRLQ